MQDGYATWYGGEHHGGPTASGERFNKNAMTAAHRTLPMRHAGAGDEQDERPHASSVRINDRGPYGNAAASSICPRRPRSKLDMIEAGVVPVRVEVIEVTTSRR